MDINNPEQVLKQVEALFSAIELLPAELKGEALKKIHSKLGVQPTQSNENADNASSTNVNSDASEEQNSAIIIIQEQMQQTCDSHASEEANKVGDCASAKESNETTDERLPRRRTCARTVKRFSARKKSTQKTDASKPPLSRSSLKRHSPRFIKSTDKNAIENEDTDEQQAKRRPNRGQKDSDNYIKEENPEIDENAEENDARPKSRRKPKTPQKIHRKSAQKADDSDFEYDSIVEEEEEEEEEDDDDGEESKEDFPVNVYRVPSGVKLRHISQHLEKAVGVNDCKRVKGMTTVYGCTVCDKKFSARSLVRVHMRTHTGEKPHVCTICQKAFTQRGALNVHMQRHQGVQNFSCPHCSYKSLGKIDMIRHVARHTGERNYFCEICAKRFVTDPSLKDHIRHVHERANTYICQICGFVTHRSDNLRRHINLRHSNKEYVQCPVCNEVIKQRSSFITHMRTHTGERPHCCTLCGKGFKNHSQVAAHMRTHTDGTFECNECNRRFKTRFHLRRHSLVHTGEKPFKCMYCAYSCNVKGNINKHVKMVHGIKDFSFKTINGPKKVIDELFDAPQIEQLKEKGEAMAQEFLTKLSIRKEEKLTVEALQQALEEKKRQKENQFILGNSVEPTKKKQSRPRSKKKPAKKKETEDVIVDYVESASGSVETDDGVIQEIHIEDVAEEAIIGLDDVAHEPTTIIIPPNGYICMQQPDIDSSTFQMPLSVLTATDDKMAQTTFYVIQCTNDEEEVTEFQEVE